MRYRAALRPETYVCLCGTLRPEMKLKRFDGAAKVSLFAVFPVSETTFIFAA